MVRAQRLSYFRASMVASVVLLAGCLGGQADSVESNLVGDSADDSARKDGTAATRTPLHWSTVAPVVSTVEFTGDFRGHQASFPVGAALHEAGRAPEGRHEHELGKALPTGVPVRVVIELNADLSEGDLDIWMEGPFEELWTSQAEAPYGGYTRLDNLVIASGAEPWRIVVWYDEPEPVADFSYTVQVTFTTIPDVLPPGLPGAVPLAPGDMLVIEPLETRSIVAFLWAPNDGFLGWVPVMGVTEWVVGPDQEPGDYVIMVPEGGPAARLAVIAEGDAARAAASPAIAPSAPSPHPPRTLGILDQIVTNVDGINPVEDGRFEFSFDLDLVPLQVGFWWQGSDLETAAQGSLWGPSNELSSLEIEGGPWLHSGWGLATDMGAQGLEPGTYTAEATYGPLNDTEPRQAGYWFVTYGR